MTLPAITAMVGEQVAALREGAGVRALDAMGALGVRGRDRSTWLNGMITNDVRVLPAGRSVYAAVVGLKGKILTDVWVDAREDELLLVMPKDRLAEVSEHFDRYIVMEDVFVSPREVTVLSVQGPRADEATAGLAGRFFADRLGRGGQDLVLDDDTRTATFEALAQRIAAGALTVVSDEAWNVARLEAGVGVWSVDFDGNHFVQEAGITGRAVSFHKGCYLGQEVVCRLEMRGHVQKKLTALVVDGAPPAPGTPVMSEGREVGRVTSAAPSVTLADRAVALAMVKHAVVEAAGPVTVGEASATIVARPVP